MIEKEFNAENYLVIKTELLELLENRKLEQLKEILNEVHSFSVRIGQKPPYLQKYIVINEDEPYANIVKQLKATFDQLKNCYELKNTIKRKEII